jgi:Transcription factor Tfb4
MNCIFSAQKQSVALDACVLRPMDSLFLQQASHLTGGVYRRPSTSSTLLQILLTDFLPDSVSRKHLVLPQQESVDYRATCFCHKRIVQQGVVCPVCLSSTLLSSDVFVCISERWVHVCVCVCVFVSVHVYVHVCHAVVCSFAELLCVFPLGPFPLSLSLDPLQSIVKKLKNVQHVGK